VRVTANALAVSVEPRGAGATQQCRGTLSMWRSAPAVSLENGVRRRWRCARSCRGCTASCLGSQRTTMSWTLRFGRGINARNRSSPASMLRWSVETATLHRLALGPPRARYAWRCQNLARRGATRDRTSR